MIKTTTFFSVSGLTPNQAIGHKDGTEEIWSNYTKPKSDCAKEAIIDYAISQKWYDQDNGTLTERANDAFRFLLLKFKGATYSWIVRECILNQDRSIISS